MNKHTVITIIAIVAIIIPFAYSVMNIYAAEQVKFRSQPEKFSFFELSNNGKIELCNAVPYPANFKSFQITPFYDGSAKGTFHIENISLEGSQSNIQQGRFLSDSFVEAQHMFMQMDFQFDGGDVRIDPRKLQVQISIDTPIIGVIPYSTVSQYDGFDFDKLMNEENFGC